MTGVLTYLWVGILLGWAAFGLLSFVADSQMAFLVAIMIAGGMITGLHQTIVIRGLIAVLEPVGVVLPLMAMWHVAGRLGVSVPVFSTVELSVFLVAYVAFLAASVGVIPVEVYRLGYGPIPVAVMVLALCAYGAVTGNVMVPLVAVAGQALWVMGWGSSNWFDHVLHAMLVPVVIVVLVMRVI